MDKNLEECKGIMVNSEKFDSRIFILRSNGSWSYGTVYDMQSERTFVRVNEYVDMLLHVKFAENDQEFSKTIARSTVGYVPNEVFDRLLKLTPVDGLYENLKVKEIYEKGFIDFEKGFIDFEKGFISFEQ